MESRTALIAAAVVASVVPRDRLEGAAVEFL
jgi:hypothetical protein